MHAKNSSNVQGCNTGFLMDKGEYIGAGNTFDDPKGQSKGPKKKCSYYQGMPTLTSGG